MTSLYVDDCFIVGNKEATHTFKEEINRSETNVTYSDGLTDYLSCEVVFSSDKKKAWLGQPHLTKKLKAKFGEATKGMQKYKTPGTPGLNIPKAKEGDETLDAEDQSQCRSGVGLLLHLVKWSRPDIANATRELAKHMMKASPAAKKELLRVIKCVLDTEHLGLKIAPTFDGGVKWEVIVHSDSNWAQDPDDRVSASGTLCFVNEVLVMGVSRKQKATSLSSSEAEFCACSEAGKDIKFIVQLMLSMGMPVELPVVVKVDNIGATFLAENATSAARTRHIDTRHRFVREMTEEKFLKMAFVRSEDNKSDGHTKNLGEDLHSKHSQSYVFHRTEIEAVAAAVIGLHGKGEKNSE